MNNALKTGVNGFLNVPGSPAHCDSPLQLSAAGGLRSCIPSSSNWLVMTADGAFVNGQAAVCVLGKAMTSRMDDAESISCLHSLVWAESEQPQLLRVGIGTLELTAIEGRQFSI